MQEGDQVLTLQAAGAVDAVSVDGARSRIDEDLIVSGRGWDAGRGIGFPVDPDIGGAVGMGGRGDPAGADAGIGSLDDAGHLFGGKGGRGLGIAQAEQVGIDEGVDLGLEDEDRPGQAGQDQEAGEGEAEIAMQANDDGAQVETCAPFGLCCRLNGQIKTSA